MKCVCNYPLSQNIIFSAVKVGIYFKEIRTCSVLCTGSHPFATVERYGRWYYSRGREKEAGPHTSRPQWWLFTRDKDLAISTARQHIEK